MKKKKLINFLNKKWYQNVLNKLYLLALTGMNYGNANTLGFEETGEKKVIEYIANKTTNTFIFFDVGANAGDYCKLVSKILKDKNLAIYAFEPSKFTFSSLIENTATINVKHFNFGLGDKEETVTIYSNYETTGAATIYKNALDNYSFNKNLAELIEVKIMDEVCKEESVTQIDFLKIDVEGHEYKVLLGCKDMIINKRIKFIQFEFGPFNVYSRTYFKDFWDLLSSFYNIYRIVGNGLYLIKSYNENLEIFRTANFLAEIKSK